MQMSSGLVSSYSSNSDCNVVSDHTQMLQSSSVDPLSSPRLELIQRVRLDIASVRNHTMPPPPHSYLNNNSIRKNYNNRHSDHWSELENMTLEGGDYTRCTLHGYDSNDNCHSQSQSSVLGGIKGVKRLHDVYTMNRINIHSTPRQNGIFYNTPRSQSTSILSPHLNSCYNKRRYQNSSGLRNPDRSDTRRRPSENGRNPQLIAPDRYLLRADEVEVTGIPTELRVGNSWDELSSAIWTKFIQSQQAINIYKDKMNLWKTLYILVKTNFPKHGLFVVGSTISGFGSNTSDMDMCLLVRPTEMDQRCEAVLYLEMIQKLLIQCDFIKTIELIQAKVPILKFRDSNSNLEVDLNCNNLVGIRNTHLLRFYAGMDWRVRPLVLIVKLWAQVHRINDAKNMTISSYSLALMVIHFLQSGVAPPVIPCLHGLNREKFNSYISIYSVDMLEYVEPFQSDNKQSLGELLFRFLEYYSFFDYSSEAISVRLGSRIKIDECRRARALKNDPHQWKLLCIEEPFDLTNTARSVYDPDIFERIKTVFIRSYCHLKDTRSLEAIFQTDEGSNEDSLKS